MKLPKQPTILNSKGEPIILNAMERQHASWMQRQLVEKFGNSLGYEIPVTTLTAISRKISEQKFFEVTPSDYIPVLAGQGAWSSNITTYRAFDLADEFETGIVNTAGNTARQAAADAGVDSVNIRVNNWTKTIGWNIFELQLAARSGNWDVVSAKEKARKRNWDLGVQRIAFLGARGQNAAGGTCLGLLNQPGCTINTTVITQPISAMNPDQLKAFQQAVIEAYRANCNRTAWPDRFVIPESDYNGLASQASADFPVKSVLQLLEEAFAVITRQPGFKILPLAYADAAYHTDAASIVGKQVYSLYRSDEESINMNVPVVYTNTLANSLDNMNFQNCGYGQFTGVQILRNLEMLYFQY